MKKIGNKGKKIIYDLILVIAVVVFLYSAYQLYLIFSQNYAEKKETEIIQETAGIPDDIGDDEEIEEKEFSVDWNALKQINEDIVGWILIPDTEISYPIVHGDDNSYYLTHTAGKVENYAGAIFMDCNADGSFEDLNTFIYGHNVKHGTMFAEIENFKTQSFFDSHPYVYIFTPDVNYRCEVFSIYSTTCTSDSYDAYFADEEEYQNYLAMIKGLSDFSRDIDIDSDDHIMTISTCSYELNGEASEMRYLLHAKLVPWEGSLMVE